ncbi:hypothetical protein K504DRAFT_459548 [Pleomassaria siparia CBS 279.74]|uniref:Tudor domain-containing protein n=1 Tax=Pleomassaria siparia CBS 279.74 TaxID=1314801 RepID=A0A6G1K1H6_9PLEO|nr:hypothetical protein K504DRAFT_459548 [Pleomassaria siparia CBS 279.74]
MADIQALKDAIWLFKRDKLAPAQTDYAEWTAQLAIVDGFLEKGIGNAAENEATREEVLANVVETETQLSKVREELAALEAQLPETQKPKFDPEKHPLLKKAVEKAEPVKAVVFNTGDICEALWTDKQWYKAKIQTILGAASAPKYHVKFIEYDDSMTVDRDAIRPLINKRKREPETAPSTPTVVPTTSSPHVISAPASINPDAQRVNQASEAGKPIPHKRTIGSNKALGNRVDSWKNWNSKGVGKKIAKKDSMFRSGTTVNSRVGFTGSGAGMRETTKRVRHNTKADAEEEEATEGGSAGRVREDRRQDNHPRTRF